MKESTHTGATVLAMANATPAGSRNEGRYWYSEPFGRLRQFWATVGTRAEVDHFGVQFIGVAGQSDAAHYEAALESAGFYRRRDTRNNATYALRIPFKADGLPDRDGIQQARAILDGILNDPSPTAPSQTLLPPTFNDRRNFATELRKSLPFFVDLELPERSIEMPREISF